MAENEITDIGVMSGKPYGTAPLSADMQYLETYTSSALNRKLKGIVLPGFYLGFVPIAGTGLNVVVTSKEAPGGQGAASIDVNAHQITIQHLADLTLPVVAGKTTRIVLEANYKIGTKTDQVDITSSVKAARVFAQDLAVAIAENQLELCRVIVPASATQVTQAMIVTTSRINRQVGVTLDSIFTSDDELTAANLKGLKILKGLIDTKLDIKANGADIEDKAAFRKNIGLDQLQTDSNGAMVFEGAGGIKVAGAGSFTSDGNALQVQQKTTDKSYLLRGKKADGTWHWYVGQKDDNTDTVTWGNSIPNTWMTLAADGTGASNVLKMTFQGDLATNGGLTASNGSNLTGAVNVYAKGGVGVGDLTSAALYVCGFANDGTQGITVSSFAPNLAFIDRSTDSSGFRWRGDSNYLRLDVDNRDGGVTWNQNVALFSEKGHLSVGGGSGNSAIILSLGNNTAGNRNMTGASQLVAMAYANIGADATTRGIGYGAEMTVGDGTTAQTMTDWVEFWANSNVVNANAAVSLLSSFRSYDKTSTSIGTAYAFDGRQTARAGVNRWNLFMQGSAPNLLNGQTIIGGTDTTLPNSKFGLEVRAAANFKGVAAFTDTSHSATATFAYRSLFARNGGPGYQTFTRDDVLAKPAADMEIGRIGFGYGMNGSDSWGTGGVLGYINFNAQQVGGGQMNIMALNGAGAIAAAVIVNGGGERVDIRGYAYFDQPVRANQYIDLGQQNATPGGRQITYYSNGPGIQTGVISVDGKSLDTSTMTLTAGSVYMPNAVNIGKKLTVANEIVSSVGGNNFRALSADYGVIHRNDNNSYYMLVTNQSDPQGGFNDLRPFAFSLATGKVTMSNGAYVRGSFDVEGTTYTKILNIGNRISIGNVGTGNFNTTSASINIGDSDTGLVCPGDGILDFYCNDVNTVRLNANYMRVYGPVVSEDTNGFRIRFNNSISMFHRFDGSNYYMMVTNQNDPDGTYNGARPFAFNASTGNVNMAHNVTIGGQLFMNNNISIAWGGRGHWYQENGDIVNQNNAASSIFQGFGSNTLSGALIWLRDNANNQVNNVINDHQAQLNDRYHAARFTNVRAFSSNGNDWGNAVVCFVGDFGASDGYGRICDMQLYKNNAGWLQVGFG